MERGCEYIIEEQRKIIFLQKYIFLFILYKK